VKNITIKRVIVILFSAVVFLNVMAGVMRPLLSNFFSNFFGPSRSELLEDSKFAHLTSTCFDNDSLEICENVSLDIIRDRIQPELEKYDLTFIDYFYNDVGKFGEFISPYEIPDQYDKAKYLLVEYHILIAKNANNEQRLVIVPYEIIKNSNQYIYHSPFYTTLNYEHMLQLLESHAGESITFNYKQPLEDEHTFKVVLSEIMFKPYKYLFFSVNEEIIIFTATSLFIEVDGNWIPYTSSYQDSIAIKIVYTELALTIFNADGFILDPITLFEFPTT